MNANWITALSALMVSLGVLAELHLMRMLLREAHEPRRGRRAAPPRPQIAGRESLRDQEPEQLSTRWPALTAAGLLILPSIATAGEPDDAPATRSALGSEAPPLPEFRFEYRAQPPEIAPAEKLLTISTNRPSFNDTTGIVPIGHFQLEMGYTFTYRDRDGVESQTHTAPEILARLPILDDRLELQLGTAGYIWTSSNDGSGSQSNEGFSDMTIGLRFKVLDEDGWLPRIALQASTTTSLGSDGISNQDLEPVFKFIWSYDLGAGWGVYGNVGVGYLSTSGERFVQGQGGVCVSYMINDKWSVYGEYYLFGPNSKGTDAAHYTDFGAAYLITPRIQLDARIGAGLNDEANNFFTGVGISFLF